MKAAVVLAALVAAVTACTVDGEATPVEDLTPRTVDAAAFPYGPATSVPAAQAPNALADITFTPLQADNDPADCTPPRLDPADAKILVGPGGPAGGTVTVLLAHVDDGFDAYVHRLRACGDMGIGGTVGTRVRTRIGTVAGDTVESGRTLTTGGTEFARVYELAAQQGDVRLQVQNRFVGGDLSPAERAATRTLFDTAYAAAFGG